MSLSCSILAATKFNLEEFKTKQVSVSYLDKNYEFQIRCENYGQFSKAFLSARETPEDRPPGDYIDLICFHFDVSTGIVSKFDVYSKSNGLNKNDSFTVPKDSPIYIANVISSLDQGKIKLSDHETYLENNSSSGIQFKFSRGQGLNLFDITPKDKNYLSDEQLPQASKKNKTQ